MTKPCAIRVQRRFGAVGAGVVSGTVGATLLGVGEHELRRVRAFALALPEVSERLSHGAPCFFVRDKRPLCYVHGDDFDDRRRVSLMCPTFAGVAESLAGARPERFYRPATSASGVFRDWLGMFLDDTDGDLVDWDEVADIVENAYRLVAPSGWWPGSTAADEATGTSRAITAVVSPCGAMAFVGTLGVPARPSTRTERR